MPSPPRAGWQVELVVDGAPIACSDFVADVLGSTIRGMLGALKGVPEDPERITITIRRPPADRR